MIADRIQAYLDGKPRTDDAMLKTVAESASVAFRRQFMEERGEERNLRLSAAGKCPRQLAYKLHGFAENGKTIDARAKVNFFYGDIIELMILNLGILAGCDIRNIGQDQLTVTVPIGETIVEGHPDGLYYEAGERSLIECKSMNDFAFKEFEDGNIDEGYIAQVQMYMKALDIGKCVFLAVNKQSGVLKERIVSRDLSIIRAVEESLACVIDSTPENLPKRGHGPNTKGKLPFNCDYCAFYRTCWPKAQAKVERGRTVHYVEITPDWLKGL